MNYFPNRREPTARGRAVGIGVHASLYLLLASACAQEVGGAAPSAELRARNSALVADAKQRLGLPTATPISAGARQRATVRLGATAKEPFQLVAGGASVAVSLLGASAVPSTESDGYTVYAGALAGADLLHRVSDTGTEDYVRFASKPTTSELRYTLQLNAGVRGLRLVANTLEMLDESGSPRLRVDAPYGKDANGKYFPASLSVEGCAVDTDVRAPWGRATVDPGAGTCVVHVKWSEDVNYPALIDPSWTTASNYPIPVGTGVVGVTPSGKVLLAGGSHQGVPYRNAYLYDFVTDSWAATSSLLSDCTAWAEAPKLSSGDLMFACDVVQLYNEASGVFTALPTQPTTNARWLVPLPDNKVMLTAGYAPGVTLPWQIYDATAGVYTDTTPPTGLTLAFRLPGGDVLAGNYLGSAPWARWNPTSNTWAAVPSPGVQDIREQNPIPSTRDFLVLHTAPSNLAGIPTTTAGRFLIFDPKNNTWSSVEDGANGWLSYTFNAENGKVYNLTEGGGGMRVWDPASNTASGVNSTNSGGYGCYAAIAHIPDGRFVVVGGDACNGVGTTTTFVYGCDSNADCAGAPFGMREQTVCDTQPGPDKGLCKLPNGERLLARGLGGELCTSTTGGKQCASGVCSTLDNACGLLNGQPAVDRNGAPTTNPAVCRSNFVNADGRCGQPNSNPLATPATANACTEPNPAPAVTGQCRSGVCFSQDGIANPADNQCGEPNGERCSDNIVCRTACVAIDGVCGLLAGTPCTKNEECRSNLCAADGKCGAPNGAPCTDAGSCRSGACQAGLCAASCSQDSECGAAFWCDAATSRCAADGSNGQKPSDGFGGSVSCSRAAQCSTQACGADGLCGLPDGDVCPSDVRMCRSQKCSAGKCGNACSTDSDCGAGSYCDESNPANRKCVLAEPNGSMTGPDGATKAVPCVPSRAASQCASGVCNADGRCGDPDGAACASAATCRSGGCQSGVCISECAPKGAVGDSQCGPGFYCTNPVAPAVSGLCAVDAANGNQPTDGTTAVPCDRPGQCASGVCFTDGRCGIPDASPCGSAAACRSNICLDGICGGAKGCLSDANCASTSYCKDPGASTGTCTPKAANGAACTSANTCLTNICNADGLCGQPKGQSCGVNVACRSNLCDTQALVCVGCTRSDQCSVGQQCESGVQECKDKDSDGDGIADKNEWGTGGSSAPRDTDGDGKPDYMDDDDDGDGLLTKDELGPGGANAPRDTDGDGKSDYMDDDDDNDSILTKVEVADAAAAKLSDDVDGDGKKNWLDTDADDDGIVDGNENTDANGNGIRDYLEKPGAVVTPGNDAGAGQVAMGGSLQGGGLDCAAAPGTAGGALSMLLMLTALGASARRRSQRSESSMQR